MTTLGHIGNFAGQEISLNQRKTTYFGIGKLNKNGKPRIWLHPAEWFIKLPPDITVEEEGLIIKGLQNNDIVLGKQWIPALRKDSSVLEKYWHIASGQPLSEKNKKPFIELIKAKQAGNYTALEIFKYCLDKEKEKTRRDPWIKFFLAGMDSYSGPVQLVEDSPEEAYKVIVDPLYGVIAATDVDSTEHLKYDAFKKQPKAAMNKRKKELDQNKDKPARNEAINKALE